MTRRSYKGSSQPTVLTAPISNSDLSASVADGSTLPTGLTGPFVLTVNRTKTGEEKILCSSRSSNSLVFAQRGFDGTTPASHGAGESVEHTISAVDLDEANAHVNSTTSVHGIADTSTLLTTAAANALYAPITAVGLVGAVTASVVTTETTTSATFTDLTTVLSVVATIGSSGKALVIVTADIASVTTVGAYAVAGFAVSGATTVPATDSRALSLQSNSTTSQRIQASAMFLVTGLTAGLNTFTQKYRVTAGTGVFDTRSILVIPA